MPDTRKNLYLYEALELRAEYEARINTLKGLLPEARENRNRFQFLRDEEIRHRPAPGFDAERVRQEIAGLEQRKRKLNNTVQRANFENHLVVDGQDMNLAEALEMRKTVNAELGELSSQLATAAYERVIYKEGRDIVETPELDFHRVAEDLEGKRRLFRDLNRKLRAASFEITIDFKDEKVG